jgi:abortive infection bacteriophage resistance protein
MPLKPALSIHDQLDLLSKRGMVIDDEKAAEIFLASNHYYRLNIYFHKLMDSRDHFRAGTHFSKVIAIYDNDRWFRNRLLTILEPIEINARTQISYYMGITFGSDAFYQNGICKNAAINQSIIDNFNSEVTRNTSDPVIKHHNTIYGGLFPIWVVIEYLSFNTLSKYYSNLLEKDKKAIATNSYSVNDYLLGQWFHVLSVLRNICAHYGYLYCRNYSLRPIIAKSFTWDPSRNNRLFAMLLVMRRLSDNQHWKNFIQTISDREEKNTSFIMKYYGFPENWQSYLI